MKETQKIAVIGSNMIDLVTKIIRMPKVGETIEAPDFQIGFGGKGANQAVASAKLGADVLMITKVGDDVFGKEYIENFKRLGINTKYVKQVNGFANGVAPIFVDQNGSNSILIIKGANKQLSPADIDEAAPDIKKCSVIVLQLEVSLETVYYAVAFGAKHGIPVILNPAPAAQLDFKSIATVDFFAPNETELELISGMPVKDAESAGKAAKALIDKGLKTVIVTLGSKGALYVSAKETRLIPPFEVKPVDTTGAGDAFIGSFAYFFLKTKDVFLAMKQANCYAGLSTTREGTQKSFYSWDEFKPYMEK
jgi:ribokinase